MSRPDPESFLPLSAAVFHILLALAADERHGYGILQDVAARSEGSIRLGPATLYRSIQRMLDDGLIEEVDDRATADDDERRRYYRVTPFGRAVARAETARLADLVRLARASGVVPRRS